MGRDVEHRLDGRCGVSAAKGRRSATRSARHQLEVTIDELDAAVEQVTRRRDELLRDVAAPGRAEDLARLFDAEARLWSQLYELTSLRVVWRAALAAEALARGNAAAWRRRAVQPPAIPIQLTPSTEAGAHVAA